MVVPKELVHLDSEKIPPRGLLLRLFHFCQEGRLSGLYHRGIFKFRLARLSVRSFSTSSWKPNSKPESSQPSEWAGHTEDRKGTCKFWVNDEDTIILIFSNLNTVRILHPGVFLYPSQRSLFLFNNISSYVNNISVGRKMSTTKYFFSSCGQYDGVVKVENEEKIAISKHS